MRSITRKLTLPLILTLVIPVGLVTAEPAFAQPAAPLYETGTDEVPGRYIVVLKRGPEAAASTLARPLAVARGAGGAIRQEYTAALQGFSADLPAAAIDKLRRDPSVEYVQAVRVHRQAAGGSQSNAPWHLDRVDQRQLPLNTSYTYPDDGAGVNVYVLDSGVRAGHTEFEGRARGVYDAIRDGNGTNDCAGHGTFVASHIAGKTFGVAKKANIKAVRLLNCGNGSTTEQAVDGMNWTARNAVKPAVVNMSYQSRDGVADRAMDDAAKGLIDAGLLTVFIVGNFNKGDCQNSPKDSRAITMANSNRNDQRHTTAGKNPSSYGPCVTAFAPGANVTGAYKDSDTATVSGWNGTSFSAPLAAGVIVILLENNPGLTMAAAKQHIIDRSTKGVLTNIGAGSPNRLLFVG